MRNCSPKGSLLIGLLAFAGMAFAGTSEEKTRTEVRRTEIKPTVRYQFDRSLRPGAIRKIQDGTVGTVEKTFVVTYVNEQPVEYKLVSETKTPAKDTVFLISRAGYPTSRGSFVRGSVINMSASAYDPNPRGGSGRTKLGHRAGFGHVAVDPRVVPLGSLLYIEGYGFALASDTGGAIKGKKIDLCYDSRARAFSFGRRKVTVHVLKSAS